MISSSKLFRVVLCCNRKHLFCKQDEIILDEVARYYDPQLGKVDENKVLWENIGNKLGLLPSDVKYRWKLCLDVNKKRGKWTQEVL